MKRKEEKPEEEENQKRNEMELLAAAAPLEVMEDLRLMTRKAGLKLTFAAPEVSACENLLHYKLRNEQDKDKEYGILDLGSTSSRHFYFQRGQTSGYPCDRARDGAGGRVACRYFSY